MYQELESSRESGSPVYFYQFSTADTITRFCNAEEDILSQGHLWSKIAITHSEIKSSTDISKNSIKVQLVNTDEEFQSQFVNWSQSSIMSFTLFRGHVGESEVITYWKGRLSSVDSSDEGKLILVMESFFTSLSRAGLRGRFQRSCRHALYSAACGINREDYATQGTISDVSGLVLTITEAALQPDNYYTGGIVLFSDQGYLQITGHQGSSVTVSKPNAAIGTPSSGYGNGYGLHYGGFYVTIYPGCDRTLATCKGKFNNIENNGGFKWIPTKNIFSGTSIA